MKTPVLFVLGCCLALAASLRAQTDIRSSFNGKRLLFVHGSDVRPDPNGHRVLFIDGDFLRPDPNGKRLLYVDQDGDIRPDLHGVRLACWDGTELRRTPGGLRLGLVDDKDFRPEPGFKTYFYMDGPPLTRMQLTAVLYLLKPEFFQISPEEKVAKEKETAQNGAAEEARRGADAFPGEHPILAHSSTMGAKRAGTVQITGRASFMRSRSRPATILRGKASA